MTTPADRFGYPDFNGCTILVIDDHEDGLDFVAELLMFCGAKVLKAPSTAPTRERISRSAHRA
jgi:CheY-like chemotaxis protein